MPHQGQNDPKPTDRDATVAQQVFAPRRSTPAAATASNAVDDASALIAARAFGRQLSSNLPSVADKTLLANFSGASAVPTAFTMTQIAAAVNATNNWAAPQNVSSSTLTDAATITPNGNASNNFYLLTTSAIGGTRNMAVPSGTVPTGAIINVEVEQPATGGPCAIVWAAGWKWGKGGQDPQPIGSTIASSVDTYSFQKQSNGNYHGVMIGQSGPTGAGYYATSTTSLTPGTGSRALTTQAGLAYTVGARARATSASTGDYFEGLVTGYVGGVLTINAANFSGSTARTDWNINVSGDPGPASTVPGPAGASSSAGPSGTAGRLTLTTGVPVTTADVTGATTVYFTPYKGNQVQLWDGANWTTYTFTETSLALGTKTAALPYDVFARQVAGVLTLDDLAWTNTTTRATAVTIQDGRYCKSGDKTRLYLGTYYTTSTTTTADAGAGSTSQVGAQRFLWNNYNRVPRNMRVKDTTASWSYVTATIRQANAAAGNKVEFVLGLAEDEVRCTLQAHVVTSSNSARMGRAGIGLDSTTTFATDSLVSIAFNPQSLADGRQSIGRYEEVPAAGYHYLAWLEYGPDGTCSWQGSGNGGQSGMVGSVMA